MEGRESKDQVWAVIPAAGLGRRMGGFSKGRLVLLGRPVLYRTLLPFLESHVIDGLVIVLNESELQSTEEAVQAYLRGLEVLAREAGKPLLLVAGGERRQDSVLKGLLALEGKLDTDDLVVVHDGARPLLTRLLLERAVEAAKAKGPVVVGLPVRDTLKVVDDEGDGGVILETADRTRFWMVQTPQVFPFKLLKDAHDHAATMSFARTDDASLVEALGFDVWVIPGEEKNIKLTVPGDLVVAEAILSEGNEKPRVPPFSVGIGYDVHRVAAGRRLILGGIEIPWDKGLEGHSDADVLLHAIMDALLGAAGAGDLGTHFPDTDPSLRGISSTALAKQVLAILERKGIGIVHLDATVVAQQPRLAPLAGKIRHNLSVVFGLRPDQVNLKATTTEGLGFAGRGEGISAYAVALVTCFG